jgi:predicted nucleic acid-binding protein
VSGPTIVDTGPIVAVLNARDTHHDWAVQAWAASTPPLLTCEAVISEACFLLRHDSRGPGAVFGLIARCVLDVSFSLAAHHERVASLLVRYGNVPMSLADACLVRLSEIASGSSVMTLDSDFRVYRRHGRHVIPLITVATRGH